MSKNKVNYIITDNNITVNYDGETHIVSRKEKLADQLIDALRKEKMELIPNLVSAANRIEKFSDGNFVVKDGEILINGVVAPPVLGNKIVNFANEGLPYKPLVRFAENLQKNPSFRAVNELFSFLEKNDHPITSDGNFIAYKKVRKDFKDIYSGTFDNSIGKVVSMPRNQVNENAQETCSNGLHVANWNYAHNIYGSTNDIMLEVEVNPANVVSVPIDYDNSKMRVCEYTVLGVVNKEHSSNTSLRKTNSTLSETSSLDEEDDLRECNDCGKELSDYEDEVCEDCADLREEEDRAVERAANEYSIVDEEEDEDEYPFEDDFKL